MAIITFRCEFCSHRINADEGIIGQRVRCPNKECQQVIAVLAPQPAAEPGTLVTLPTKLLDALLGQLRFLRGHADPFWKYQRVMARIGVHAILVAGGLIALQLIIAAIRMNQMNIFGLALAALGATVLLHYLAAKFAMAGELLLRGTPETIGHMGVPDCFGLCAAGGAILLLLGGTWVAIQTRSIFTFGFSFVGFLILAHGAIFYLNAEDCLNIRHDVEKKRPGSMALAIIVFLARGGLAIAPVDVALLAGVGAIWAAVSLVQSFGSDNYAVPQIESLSAAGGYILLVIYAGIIPLLAYLSYLLYMLFVELCQAVLTLLSPCSVPAAKAETQPSEGKGISSAAAANVYCPNCGAKNQASVKFCESCGKPLGNS
jgi:hypothetical protein